MPEMGSARDELLVEARHLTVQNGGLSRPATLQIVETSIASSGVRGGRMSGSHPASIFVPIVSSPFSSPSAHSRGVSLYLRVSVDRTAVARHSEDPSIGGGKSWKRAEVFSVLGLSDQAIHDAHGHRGLLADRHGLGAAASRPESWMTQCPPGRRDAAPAPNDVILGPLIAFVRLPLHGQLRQPLRPVPAAGRLSRALAGHTSGTAVAHVVHHPRCEGGSR